jgi:23S rRNA G2445 N2-methylase RlmL
MSAHALPRPYYADDWVTLYQGDCRDIVPALAVEPDLVLTDPPYGINWKTDGRSRGGE